MSDEIKSFNSYIQTLQKKLASGDATEHTHRSALETLVESLVSGINATNEPKHIECGAPDFILRKGSVTIGYIEAKDIGESLDKAEKSEQLKRYRDSLTNLILTDYLEFRWYVDGEKRLSARLGSPSKDGKIRRDKDGTQKLSELLTNFLSHKAEGVGTPKELARRMARQAHLIRNLIINAFQKEVEGGSLHTQLVAFRDNLIPDLSVEYFADMYAQTIAYGLFAARCTSKNGAFFTRLDAAQNLPRTNPFLRKLFQYIAGYDLDDRISWLVDDLAQVLAQADMEAVLKDFGKHSGKEDPVVHFYETFLKEYDEKIREMRGVYYTPEPVVSYIVRSIDHLLKTRFNKPQGLADDKTLILDPAVGTATFLYMVINEIYQANIGKGQQGLWNNYVAEKLLPRIFGFELLMAPYAVAHLKLGLLLQETGYEFLSDQRLGIYLTNTLDEAIKHSETLFAEWISEEANAAARVKKDEPIMVVLGNPPYSGHSANKGAWARDLVEVYKKDCPELYKPAQAKWLQDDYVKFLAFGQWRIERTGQGILGFITNHAYLDNPTFRGMRRSLMSTFNDIYILNLHGNAKKKEVTPDGSKDENVFDIQQGVAICLLVKEPDNIDPAKVHYADLWGARESKYYTLSDLNVNNTTWEELKPHDPYYLFVKRDETDLAEYMKGWKLQDIMNQNGDPAPGIVTTHDEFAISWSAEEASNKVKRFLGTNSEDEARELFRLCKQAQWNYERAKQELSKYEWEKEIKLLLYRPFDVRWTVYNSNVAVHRRERVMRHMLAGENLGLCTNREVNGDFHHVLCSRDLINDCTVSLQTRERTYLFPLYLYPAEGEMQFDGGKRRPNLNPEFINVISEKLGLTFIEDGRGDIKQNFGPEDIFNYAYAVFHSPTYRTRYAEFLKIDFPRLPLTSDKRLFKALAEKGAELVSLHLMESPVLNNLITGYPVAGSNEVEKVDYDSNNHRIYINKTQYFEGVPPEVWNSHIGGYQVCQKWLKDRKGRTLTYDELTHYQKIIVALTETIRLATEIDELIPTWPIE
ncbi:MAG: N-6 DNA methylase [Dehalococcoidia bacterium]|nr:N-6 DNA methylase [Dehalococcoidia bacterium]